MTAPSIDGTITGTIGNGHSSKAVSLTTTAAGLIVVQVTNDSHNTGVVSNRVSSVAATGLTFVRLWQQVVLISGDWMRNHEIWYAVSAGAVSAKTITVTLDGNVDTGTVVAFGAKNCTGWDPNLQLPQTGITTSALTYSTDNANSLVLVFECADNAGTGPTGGGGGPATFTSVASVRDTSGFANAGGGVYSASSTSTISAGTVTPPSALHSVVLVLTNDSATAHAAPTMDGHNWTLLTNGVSTISRNLTTTQAGEVVVLVQTEKNSSSSNAATVSSVTATGLTFTKRGSVNEHGSSGSGTIMDTEEWVAPSTGALAAVSVTVTLNSTVDAGSVTFLGIAGVNSTTPMDPNAAVPAFENTGGNLSSISTTHGNDLEIWWSSAASNAGQSGMPSGFTELTTGSYNGGLVGIGFRVAIRRISVAESSATITAGSAGTNVINMFDAATSDSGASNMTLSQTLANLTPSITITDPANLALADTLDNVTSSITMTSPENFTLADTLDNLTSSITGNDIDNFVDASVLGPLTSVITITSPENFTLADTLGSVVPAITMAEPDNMVLANTLDNLTSNITIQLGGPFYFAWTPDPVPGVPDVFDFAIHGIDADRLGIFSIVIKEEEGQIPTATIEIKNPRVGLLAPGRMTWAWFSWDNGTTIIPIFRGKLNPLPENTQDEVIKLVFVARPVDYEGQKGAVAETLKVAPYWDPIWLTPQALENPDTILAAYPKLWCVDRVTNVVSVSDFLYGEDGNITLTEDEHFYDAMEIKYTSDPKRQYTVEGTVNWEQRATGVLDFTDLLIKEAQRHGSKYPSPLFPTFSGEGFANTYPLPYQTAGSGWETAPDISIVQATWEPFINPHFTSFTPALPVQALNQSSLDQNNSTGWLQPYELIVNYVKPIEPPNEVPVANPALLPLRMVDIAWTAWQATFVQTVYWIHLTMTYNAMRKRTERVVFTMTSNIQYISRLEANDLEVTATLAPLTLVTTICTGGMAPWRAETTYRRAVVVDFNGTLYQSMVDFNLNNNPEFSPKWWTLNITTPYGTAGCSTSVPFPYGPEQPLPKVDLSLSSNLVDQPVDFNGALPIGGTSDYVPQNTYFKSDRGQQSFQYLLALARAKLIGWSRAVDVRFDTTWEIGLGLNLRKNVILDDYRLPGGTATGKVTGLVLTFEEKTIKAEVTMGCAIGYGGSATATPGTPDYVDGVFDTGAVQTWSGAMIDVFAQSLLYESFDDFEVVDDGLNLFDFTPENAIDTIVIRNGIQDQVNAIMAATIPASPVGGLGPVMIGPAGVKLNLPDPVTALKNSPTKVTMTFKSVLGGPYETRFFPIVEPLQLPKMFDTEAAS